MVQVEERRMVERQQAQSSLDGHCTGAVVEVVAGGTEQRGPVGLVARLVAVAADNAEPYRPP